MAVAAVVALLTLEYHAPQKGSGVAYNGKSLEYWLSQTFTTMVDTNGSSTMIAGISFGGQSYGAYQEKPEDVKRAFWEMGTNSLPFLVRKLGTHDTRVSMAVENLKRWLKMKGDSPGRNWERGQAVTAFTYLDPLPDDIYEQIRAVSKSANPEVTASAKEVLERCHKMSDVHPKINTDR